MNNPFNKKEKSRQIALYNVMSQIASIFAKSQPSNYENAINEALKRIGTFVSADRSYIFKYDFIHNTCSNTHEYCAPGISKEIDNLQDVPLDDITDWLKTHQDFQTMYIPDVSKLSLDSQVKAILEPQNVKSLITIPLIHNNTLYGFLGFDSVLKKRMYSKFEQYVLVEFSNLLISILDRIEYEKKIKLEHIRLEMLLGAANIGAWEWNLITNETKFNKIWANLIGYELHELEPLNIETWKKFTHPDDLNVALNRIDDFLNGKTLIYEAEFRMRHKNGHYVWIKDTGKVIEWDRSKPIVMQGAHISIDQQKREQQELQVVKKAIDSSPISIEITDKEANILYVNPTFEMMTGYKIEEIAGKNPRIFKSGYHDKEFYKKLWDTVLSGQVWKGELNNKRKDGTMYWEQAFITSVRDEQNQISHFIAIKSDISGKKKIDQLIEEKQIELENEVAEKILEIEDSQQSAIIALAKLTEARDHDTGQHVERVQYLSKVLSTSLKDNTKYTKIIDNQFIQDIYYASALHDIGKINIPDSVLLKPGKLTNEEFDIIKSHVKTGEKILSDMVKFYPKSRLVILGRQIAKYHHEKWNGEGYLEGLKGDEIPLSARIMALVDVYDALRSSRPYKKPMSHQQAYDIIVQDSGTHFDPEVVDAFIKIHQTFDAIYNSLN